MNQTSRTRVPGFGRESGGAVSRRNHSGLTGYRPPKQTGMPFTIPAHCSFPPLAAKSKLMPTMPRPPFHPGHGAVARIHRFPAGHRWCWTFVRRTALPTCSRSPPMGTYGQTSIARRLNPGTSAGTTGWTDVQPATRPCRHRANSRSRTFRVPRNSIAGADRFHQIIMHRRSFRNTPIRSCGWNTAAGHSIGGNDQSALSSSETTMPDAPPDFLRGTLSRNCRVILPGSGRSDSLLRSPWRQRRQTSVNGNSTTMRFRRHHENKQLSDQIDSLCRRRWAYCVPILDRHGGNGAGVSRRQTRPVRYGRRRANGQNRHADNPLAGF